MNKAKEMEVLRLFSMISHSITCSWEVTLHFVWRVVVKNPKNEEYMRMSARAYTIAHTHTCRIMPNFATKIAEVVAGQGT